MAAVHYTIKDALNDDQDFASYGGDNNALLTSILARLNASLAVTGAFYQATQPISAASLPLPTGAALDATLQSILTKLGTARTETLWTDDTGSYFVRVDNAGTISWTDTSGTASTAPGTGSRPAAGATILLDKSSYQATAGGTGYSTGDLLDHLVTTDPATGAVIGHFWLNTTTEAKLASAPSSANITPLSPLPSGAATAVNQSTALGYLATIATNAAATGDSGVEVHQPADVITFTPTLDTAAYSSGDVLFATAALTGVTRANDLRAKLDTLTVIDKAKQNAAITLLFYQTNVTSAAANAANALSDADQLSLMGTFDIAAADWKTWANNSSVCYSGAKTPGVLLEAAAGTTTVYIVAITTSTPTFAVGDLVFKFGFLQS